MKIKKPTIPFNSAHFKSLVRRNFPYAPCDRPLAVIKNVQTGKPIIDFEANTIDGQAFKLSSLKGQYIYLTFWSDGCSPCQWRINT